jgi:hypothetical protein
VGYDLEGESMRYEELTTPEAVIAAFEAGRRVEFTKFKESDDPLQGMPGENGCGWIKPIGFAKRPYEAFARGYRYRALIEEPAILAEFPECSGDPASCPENEGYGCCKPNPAAIPEGYTPWSGGECPEDARKNPTNVIRRDGKCSASHGGPKLGAQWMWAHNGWDTDIIAYRVESEQPSHQGEAVEVADGEVLVVVHGLTGSGKSAVAGEIEILCKALGLEVCWENGDEEKFLTHADWTAALELYKPRVRIIEVNTPRNSQ